MARKIEAVRQRLVERVNHAVRHPGMWGRDEMTIRLAMADLAFVDDVDAAWTAEQVQLVQRGEWTAAGVAGAFNYLFVSDVRWHLHAVASNYAAMAHRLGWLTLDRTLSRAELDAMLEDVTSSPELRGRVLRALEDEYGPPSVRCGGRATVWPCSVVYATDSPDDGCISWDFWNRPDEEAKSAGRGVHGPEALLRNARIPADDFSSSFVYTKFGTSLRRDTPYPLDSLRVVPVPA